MRSTPTVAESVSIIATWYDVDQATWRSTVRVVIHCEHPTKPVERRCERIPETGRQMGQAGPVKLQLVDMTALTTADQRLVVGSDQPIIFAQIFA